MLCAMTVDVTVKTVEPTPTAVIVAAATCLLGNQRPGILLTIFNSGDY
jgi:hypothetical protein